MELERQENHYRKFADSTGQSSIKEMSQLFCPHAISQNIFDVAMIDY